MRPVPIPAEAWATKPRFVRSVIAAPGGDLTDEAIRPVEALAGVEPFDGVDVTAIYVALRPEGDDLARLAGGALLWLRIIGAPGLYPFAVYVADEP